MLPIYIIPCPKPGRTGQQAPCRPCYSQAPRRPFYSQAPSPAPLGLDGQVPVITLARLLALPLAALLPQPAPGAGRADTGAAHPVIYRAHPGRHVQAALDLCGAGRRSGGQAVRQAGRQAGRQSGRQDVMSRLRWTSVGQSGRQVAGWPVGHEVGAGRQAGRWAVLLG